MILSMVAICDRTDIYWVNQIRFPLSSWYQIEGFDCHDRSLVDENPAGGGKKDCYMRLPTGVIRFRGRSNNWESWHSSGFGHAKISRYIFFLERVCPCDLPTFVKTTTIAYGQNLEALGNFLSICNSSCFHKRRATTSTRVQG